MAQAPFPVDPHLTAIVIAYQNPRATYIADEVLPRSTVGKQDFKWWQFPIEETFRLPDARVGRRSRPNELVFSATEQTASTEDYGLESPVPQSDINNAGPKFDPLGNAATLIADALLIAREKRVADLVFAAANYPAGNKTTLSGSSQWSDITSSPLTTILAAMDACLVKPNTMTLGRAVWSKLRVHPEIVKSVNGNAGDKGIATRQQVADLFELHSLLVGEPLLNTAKPGQAATLNPVWGKHCSLSYVNPSVPVSTGGLTFGLTAQWEDKVAGSEPDRNIGLRGGQMVRAGESVKELIVASRAGYFIENAVA